MSTPAMMKAMIKDREVEGYTLKDIETPEPEGDEVCQLHLFRNSCN